MATREEGTVAAGVDVGVGRVDVGVGRDDRVREHTATHLNESLDEMLVRDVAAHVGATQQEITWRLQELDGEWDVERALEANASTLVLLSLGLAATHSRRWLLLATAVSAFLLQHAVQGWCPPLALLRRLGLRTRKEIDVERTALKAVRGDFGEIAGDKGDALAVARRAVVAARRR